MRIRVIKEIKIRNGVFQEEEVQEYVIRSDHQYHEEWVPLLKAFTERYVGNTDGKYQIIIDSKTLPHDPNTPKGRKELMEKLS